MQLIGGLAVPIFAFLLVGGFRNTSDYRRYLLSVFSFALLSEVPYDLAMYGKLVDASGQNALFSMMVSLLMLYFLRMEGEGKAGEGREKDGDSMFLSALRGQCAENPAGFLDCGGMYFISILCSVKVYVPIRVLLNSYCRHLATQRYIRR